MDLEAGQIILYAHQMKWYPFRVTHPTQDGCFLSPLASSSQPTYFLRATRWVGLFSSPHFTPESLWGWEAESFPMHNTGHSMGPWYPPGGRLDLVPLRLSTLRPGQLLIWAGQERWVCHRLKTITTNNEGSFVTTRGDGCLTDDNPIPITQLLGQVARIHYPKGSWEPGNILDVWRAHTTQCWLQTRHNIARYVPSFLRR